MLQKKTATPQTSMDTEVPYATISKLSWQSPGGQWPSTLVISALLRLRPRSASVNIWMYFIKYDMAAKLDWKQI